MKRKFMNGVSHYKIRRNLARHLIAGDFIFDTRCVFGNEKTKSYLKFIGYEQAALTASEIGTKLFSGQIDFKSSYGHGNNPDVCIVYYNGLILKAASFLKKNRSGRVWYVVLHD